ncbi:glycogen debranching protein GlgX [Hansschlegelia sp. KR7-227]|uniref:glycogen debranching protein GlgX n=1 Tax=Hansschlegelia sp. KR7-227 TaxID=3400914 RepID=UPI003BFB727B
MSGPLEEGAPYPLGATWDGLGVNFAVFSAHAEQIDLCLFDPSGRREIARMPLPEKTDEVFHGYLPGARAGLLYGFRAHGPYDPQHGQRFNPNKLLLDPYAKQISGEVRWSDALHGYRLHSPRGDLSFDRRDSAPGMPKGVVVDDAFNWGDDRPPNVPWPKTVIYEAHLRGLTMLRDDIRAHERGTFAALASPPMIAHYKRLGVTAVELLPIHAFVQDRVLVEKGLRNYWGYNTLGFFAPEPRYLSDGSLNEVKVAIRRLHAAGIEVILDVVYNHTAEGSEEGPTLSFRGLDNVSYYRLQQNDWRLCVNDTGTGNTLNLSHPRVLQMVMDSLRYWVEAYHVDGFRFDLSVTLGREADGFDPGSGFFDALRQDPTLSRVKLIAEPWDIGPGGYQLGHHPPGFAEWNDRFRDSIRRFWRGDEGQRPELAARLAGSSDLFDRRSRKPWASVNYAASHDGFTLADVTAYVQRHNLANGEDNRDGHGENYTSNWGVEGPSDDPAIIETRRRVARALLATVFFAQGTPMLLAGDEFGRTQNGNNNAYAQDNHISWIDWSLAATGEGAALTAFVARLIALRAAHPVLRCKHFLHGREQPAPGVLDIAWFDERGRPISASAWNDPGERTLTLRRAAKRDDGAVPILTLMLNPTAEDRMFKLPPPALPTRLLIDSADPDAPERPIDGDVVRIAARGAALTMSLYPAPRAPSPSPSPSNLSGA